MNKNNLSPGFKRFELRNGFGGFSYRGIVSEGDPGSIPPNAVRMALNARLVGGEYGERPGLSKLFTSPLNSATSAILDIVPYDPPRPLKLWVSSAGCPGLSAGFGFSVGNIDQEQNPEYQRVVYFSTAVSSSILATFGGDLYFGTDSQLRKMQLIRQPWGTESFSLSGSSQDTPIVSFTGYTIRCMQEFDGRLWIGLDNGAGASKVVWWDGVSWGDDKTGIDPPTCFAPYRIQNGGDALVMGTTTAQRLWVRSAGDSGTWTNVGTVAATQMVSFKDVLYIAGAGANLSSWNGVVLTAAARSPAGATAVRALGLFDGSLYFGYETATAAILGKYDGTTWTDIHKNITTQFPTVINIRAIASYRGFLAVAGTGGGAPGYGGAVWMSNLSDTSGTYTQLILNGSNNGTIYHLLVA